MKPVVSAGLLLLLATAPALAVGASCEAQLKSTSAMVAEKSDAKSALQAKQGQAERLCKAGQDEQAQELARQIRNELSGQGSGSSTPQAPPQKPAPPQK